jgi:sec-independent protein translocase protein TatB
VLDIGFSEIALIFTLALIVLGPEKLPRVASQVGRWIGRARGMARQFREQLEEEVNLEEVRKSKPPAVKPPPPAEAVPAATVPAPAESTASTTADAPPAQPTYPDNYSHAHDADGRPLPSATDGVPLSQANPVSATAEEIAGQPPAQAQHQQYPDHYSHAHPTDADGRPLPVETQHQQYPDHYSHAHPTDSEGRPLPPTSEAPADDSGQHDWVGVPAGDPGVTATDKPAQGTTAAGYAPPHERGT